MLSATDAIHRPAVAPCILEPPMVEAINRVNVLGLDLEEVAALPGELLGLDRSGSPPSATGYTVAWTTTRAPTPNFCELDRAQTDYYSDDMVDSEKPGITPAAKKLRKHILACESGTFIGNEDAVMAMLDVSRNTLRQVARILEREGLLRVKRGISGGYYAASPDLSTIEAAVSGYLHTLHVKVEDATMIASILWVNVLTRATQNPDQRLQGIVDLFLKRLNDISPDCSFREVLDFENDYRRSIFALVDNPYVQLIFQINAAFAAASYAPLASLDGTPSHRGFIRDWRNSKSLELATVGGGDPELTAAVARHARRIWDEWVSQENLRRES